MPQPLRSWEWTSRPRWQETARRWAPRRRRGWAWPDRRCPSRSPGGSRARRYPPSRPCGRRWWRSRRLR
ncbi:MAG: hypothetical protein E7Z95_10690 [Actinomyces succiniciruminis]|nr:hypothetical protein [Actinomyces succiniciruminis]